MISYTLSSGPRKRDRGPPFARTHRAYKLDPRGLHHFARAPNVLDPESNYRARRELLLSCAGRSEGLHQHHGAPSLAAKRILSRSATG